MKTKTKKINKLIIILTVCISVLCISIIGNNATKISDNHDDKISYANYQMNYLNSSIPNDDQYFHWVSSYKARSITKMDEIPLPQFIKAEHAKPFMHLVSGIGQPYFEVYYATWKSNKCALFYIKNYKIVNGGIKIIDYIMQVDDKTIGTFEAKTLTWKQKYWWFGHGEYKYAYRAMDIKYGGRYSSFYSDDFSSELFVNKTNKNFLNLGHSNGAILRGENPFFNRENTYNDVEKNIMNNPIIVSKDNVPINETKITFYDDKNKIINKNTKLNSSKIKIKLSGKDNNIISGETPFLNYKIPFFDINIKHTSNNIFSSDLVSKNNVNKGYWELENNKWTYKTNMLDNFEIPKNSNIFKFTINGNKVKKTIFKDDNVNYNIAKITNENDFIAKNGLVNSWKNDLEITNDDGDKAHYYMSFECDDNSKDKIKVSTMDGSTSDISTKMMFVDWNLDGVTNKGEVINTSTVDSAYYINLDNVEFYKNIQTFYYEESSNSLKFIPNFQFPDKSKHEQGITKSVMLFIYQNEYGNAIKKVVHYVNNMESISNMFHSWNYTNPLYKKIQDITIEQGIDNKVFKSFNDNQIDYYCSKSKTYDKLFNLENLTFEKEKLQKVTKNYQTKTPFKEMKNAIEQEILKQVAFQVNSYSKGIEAQPSDFRVEFNEITDDTLVTNETEIIFTVSPSNTFKARGSNMDSFKVITNLKLLDNFKPNMKKIVELTHGYDGKKFIFVRFRLKKEIFKELRDQGYDTSIIFLSWKNLAGDIVYKGTKVTGYLKSKNEKVLSGKFKIEFKIDTYTKNLTNNSIYLLKESL